MNEKEFLDQFEGKDPILVITQSATGPMLMWKNVTDPYRMYGMLKEADEKLRTFITEHEMIARMQKMQQLHADQAMRVKVHEDANAFLKGKNGRGIIHGK